MKKQSNPLPPKGSTRPVPPPAPRPPKQSKEKDKPILSILLDWAA